MSNKQKAESDSDSSSSGSDSESSDEESPKQEKSSKVSKKEKAHAKPVKRDSKLKKPLSTPMLGPPPTKAVQTGSRDQYGKDANGEYMNQVEYVKHRNQLNEAELQHSDMFANIKDKLADADYINLAVENT